MDPDYYCARSLWSNIHRDLIVIHELMHKGDSPNFQYYYNEGVRYCLLGRNVVQQITTYNDGTSSDGQVQALFQTLQPFVILHDRLMLKRLVHRVVTAALSIRDLLDKVCGWWIMFYKHSDVVLAGMSLVEAESLHCCLPAVVKVRAGRADKLICTARGGGCSTKAD